MESPRVTNALISVSDKSGLAEFAQQLAAAGVQIYSTGGTRTHLQQAGLEVRDVSEYTGFPEMMDGRLKTLHPKIFGGILCRHDRSDDMHGIAEHGIATFELVVVNLYPFEATVARDGVTMPEAIEQIDIGGPSLVRAAAKNHAFTTICTRPDQYADIATQIAADGCTTLELRRRLAGEAFSGTASYDRAIANYFAQQSDDAALPETIHLTLRRQAELRYGENPHQQAALYGRAGACGANLIAAEQLNGKELSFNNLLDLDSAVAIARSLPGIACCVLKHNNPCGAASADTLAEAVQKAMDGDPLSAFGSVLGMNRTVDAAAAEVLCKPGLFVEAIAAPDFEPEALELLTTKPKWKANVRLMRVGDFTTPTDRWQLRHVDGGALMQDVDAEPDRPDDWKVVTDVQPTDEQRAELQFAWAVVRHVKSNAIVLTNGRALCGAGAGQMSRVDSVDIAIAKAGDRARGSALGSDAFFPFPDSIHKAADAGVAALIQPGGSKRDDEVVAACNERGLAMIFTGRRHFRH